MTFQKVPLSEILQYQNRFITISEDQTYRRVRIKVHRQGMVLRDEVKGYEIKTKKQQLCKKGQFLVAEIDAKVGGYGLVPAELEGAVVSSHYFLFNIDLSKINLDYFKAYIQSDLFFSQIKAEGSTNYASIRPRDILEIEIPLPTLNEQKQIANQINNFFSVKKEIETLDISNLENVSKLRQSILQSATQGNWKNLPITKCFRTFSSREKQLKATEYSEIGKYPIVDQGKKLIPGYSNDESKLLKLKKPVVIFGDHTKQIKYIDFDFIIGADGTKILEPIEEILPKFFYYVLKSFKLENKGYARHFKILKQEEFPLPPLAEQKRIVEKVDKLMAYCDELEKQVKENQENAEKLMSAVLKEGFENQ